MGAISRCAAVALALSSGRAVQADAVSFRNDVMAVLSKAGCNQGGCHGNQNGKNGFKLSLRGEDPTLDFAALTHDMLARRTNPLAPEKSLVLLKATAAVPHEGGRRFEVGSPEYRLLADWIGGGPRPDPDGTPILERLEVTPAQQVLLEPADRVELRVRAFFSDGSTRDVTWLAVYEPSNQVVAVGPAGEAVRRENGETAILVRYLDRQATVELAFVPGRPEFVWHDLPEANAIDRHVFAKLRTLRTQPSELAPDSVFLRRAYLDAIGVLPTADEARAFLDDDRPNKRALVIDQLLERPEFADFWALKWSDLLHNEEKTLDPKGVQAFHRWIRQSIAARKPLNEFARELIAARGSTYRNPPANFYRALRDPASRAEAFAQVFLGVRIQCARCHNHPFDRWTQNDYYGLAAFFARVDYKIIENRRSDGLDQHEFDGEQVVLVNRDGVMTHPRTGEPVRPHALGIGAAGTEAERDPLEALAASVADPANPFFARAQANRVWYHLLGRGIVEPVDDFRASNPPVNAALLDALTDEFVSHSFELQHLVRTIMNSRTYQLSAEPNETNREDESNFSHAIVRPLQAEQLLDALSSVTGVPAKFTGYPLGLRAGELPGVQAARPRGTPATVGESFLKVFGKPERLLACECERSADATLGQTLQLTSGALIDQMLTERSNRIGRLLGEPASDGAIIEQLYLGALSRYPTGDEQRGTADYLAGASDRRRALEDIAWGLVNSAEFLLRH